MNYEYLQTSSSVNPRACDAHLVRASRQSEALSLCSLRGKKNLQRRLRRDDRTDADIRGAGLEATLRWRPGKMPEMLVGCRHAAATQTHVRVHMNVHRSTQSFMLIHTRVSQTLF